MFESRIERVLALKCGIEMKQIEKYYIESNHITVFRLSK
jgi:hypothetical protein